ncbi:MAG: leucine-rich repeat domain-containing protein, partial [Lewinella sp.]
MSELALKLIREAKATKATTIDLANCGLTELPDELFELVWLEELYLGRDGLIYDFESKEQTWIESKNEGVGNNIDYISDKIEALKRLKIIFNNYYSGESTGLKNLDALGNLKNLNSLYVSGAQVSDLSPLRKLGGLKVLDFSGTQVTDLSALRGLVDLEFLNIRDTQVKELTPLKKLTKLQELRFSDSRVNELTPLKGLVELKVLWADCPEVADLIPIANLTLLEDLQLFRTAVKDLNPLRGLVNLQDISVSGTNVVSLSPLKHLQHLGTIWFEDTKVSDLSPLKNLIERNPDIRLEFANCPLTNPPLEIAIQGNEAILNYWQQIEDQGGTQTINEAKLIIVGEGDTGKTTLFNKLVDPTFDLSRTKTEETQGINIHEGLEIREGFRANLWDFGGQELQYMTHQFFLTPNAVYVLMLGARGEAPNLAYWFKIISLLGKDKSGGKVSLII